MLLVRDEDSNNQVQIPKTRSCGKDFGFVYGPRIDKTLGTMYTWIPTLIWDALVQDYTNIYESHEELLHLHGQERLNRWIVKQETRKERFMFLLSTPLVSLYKMIRLYLPDGIFVQIYVFNYIYVHCEWAIILFLYPDSYLRLRTAWADHSQVITWQIWYPGSQGLKKSPFPASLRI